MKNLSEIKEMLKLSTNLPDTMTSLEMVDLLNSHRKEGEAELRHAHFLTKVPKVLGLEKSQKFGSTYVAENGKENPCYKFPEREACLMAMSYSYEFQAVIYDHMRRLEQALVTYLYDKGTQTRRFLNYENGQNASLLVENTELKLKIKLVIETLRDQMKLDCEYYSEERCSLVQYDYDVMVWGRLHKRTAANYRALRRILG